MNRHFYAALVLIIFLPFYCAKAAESQYPAQKKRTNTQNNIQPAPPAITPLQNSDVKQPETPVQERESTSEQSKPITRTQKIQIGISVVLTFIAFWQVLIYRQQRRVMERAADYTKIGERAYIGIKAIAFEHFALGRKPVFGIKFLNGGRTPAWDVSIGMVFTIGQQFPTTRPKIRSESNILPAGIDQDAQLQLPVVITAEIIRDIMENKANLFIRGEVHFRDAWRDKRKFSFNLIYRPLENRFGNYREGQQDEDQAWEHVIAESPKP